MRCRFVSEFGVLQSNHEHMLNSPIPRGFWESRICIDIPQNEKTCWKRDSKIHLKLCQETNHHATTHFPSKVVASLVSAKHVPNSHFASFGRPTKIREVGSMEQRKSTPRVLKGPKNPKIRIYGRNHLTVGFMIFTEKSTQKKTPKNTPFWLKKIVGQKLPIPLGVIHQRGLWLLEACVAFEESEPMILCKELVAKEAIRVMRKKTYYWQGEMDDVKIAFFFFKK